MRPLDETCKAEIRGYRAFRKYREGVSYSTRQKALKTAQEAEQDFIAARLAAWEEIIGNRAKTPGPFGSEGALNNNGGN
jgi:hypothetical protein